MRLHKIISTILHPIVLPTIGVLLYFTFISQSLEKRMQLIVLGLVFVLTYLVPLLLLVFLKRFMMIKDYEVSTIKERRFPVIFMIVVLYFERVILTLKFCVHCSSILEESLNLTILPPFATIFP